MSKRKLVFVVDDDVGIVRGVQRLLSARGYDSISFSSADAFQEHGDFEEAICAVLDINICDRSGIDVHHHMKAAGIRLPVIFITGKDNPGTRVAAIESGCLAYLTKPFAAESLMKHIERASIGVAQ